VKDLDNLCINTLRFLAVDAVEKAKSGHPGLPLGAAPMAYILWDRFLRHNPKNPTWINRDRFILSAGHGSALLYALLHVYGYDLSLQELKRFRQWGSKTPGHPEHDPTLGVEATTGPLGQGFAMGVGIMEGISSEAASLAGTLRLNKLIYLYDDNHISIEGKTDSFFTENVEHKFEAFNWNILKVPDGNDLVNIEKAIRKAQTEKTRPSLIMVRTHIGYGSPKQDSGEAHGAPLGAENVYKTKKTLDWPTEPHFFIPKKALEHFRLSSQKGANLEQNWRKLLKNYHLEKPKLFKQFNAVLKGELLDISKIKSLSIFKSEDGPIATRNASGKVMNFINEELLGSISYFMIGGSADLAPSTKTILKGYGDFGFSNNRPHNIQFGVREHAMGAIANGIALHSNFIPYTATFLVFSDYMRPAIRLAALMQTHVIFIFTHDSIALGEDGPTHQPIEHLTSLRAIPGLTVIRPADANETEMAWRLAIVRKKPTVLVFTRQKLPILNSKNYPIKQGVPRGAYVLVEADSGHPDLILIATGSEVKLALSSRKKLKEKGIDSRVVSMPSWEIFEEQETEYKNQILPPKLPKLALEAGVTLGWNKYVGDKGDVIGLNQFGKSAPGNIVYNNLGFNIDHVVECALKIINRYNN
jgi:transketolase